MGSIGQGKGVWSLFLSFPFLFPVSGGSGGDQGRSHIQPPIHPSTQGWGMATQYWPRVLMWCMLPGFCPGGFVSSEMSVSPRERLQCVHFRVSMLPDIGCHLWAEVVVQTVVFSFLLCRLVMHGTHPVLALTSRCLAWPRHPLLSLPHTGQQEGHDSTGTECINTIQHPS